MSLYTREELLTEIAETKLEIKNRKGISQFNFSTGMGSQGVTNRTLKELRDHLNFLESELGDLDGNGLVSGDFVREIGGI
ncbi:hypothetical protein [Flavobacterium sp.]|jgi:hypothetical protein|uniref:hypothetical protein n=1 Tax=Flavobacterium sp. TaxID=239 RepID=UPI0037C15810